jgi:ribosomal-protein-alanine N-acetyltransferase
MSGLQGAFLRAGARGVIGTLWPVEDVYASQFAADFYRRYTGGKSAAESLSETQRAWLKSSPGIRGSEQAYRRMTASAHVPMRDESREAFLEVRPSNLAAIRLYQRLGFEQIGIRRGYYQAPDGREDAIVLKLNLRQA